MTIENKLFPVCKSVTTNRTATRYSYKFDRKEKIKVVMDLYHELNIRVIAEKEMMKYFEEAMMNLDEINIPEMNKSALRQFALTLLVREH